MLFSSLSPRQTIVTVRAWFAKNSAACPAELPAPIDVDVQTVRARRLAARRAVEDALADQPLEAVDGEVPPRHAGGEDDRACSQHVAAVEVNAARVAGIDARDRSGDEDLRSEPARLLQRAAGELVARDAGRKAEVVLDPRRGPGLAAGRLPLDHDRAQALGSPVHGGGEPGRPGADDDRVVLAGGRRVWRPSSSATSRSRGRTSVVPSVTRSAGDRRPAAGRRSSARRRRARPARSTRT